jgi:hypothetical protein
MRLLKVTNAMQSTGVGEPATLSLCAWLPMITYPVMGACPVLPTATVSCAAASPQNPPNSRFQGIDPTENPRTKTALSGIRRHDCYMAL